MKKILGFFLTLTISLHATTHAVVPFDQHNLAAFAACYVQTQREAGFSDEQILREVLTKVEASKAFIEEAPVTLRTTEDNQQRILYFVAGVGSTMVAIGLVYYIIELLQEKSAGLPAGKGSSKNDTKPKKGDKSESSKDEKPDSGSSVSDNDDDYDTEPCPDSDADTSTECSGSQSVRDPHELPANRKRVRFSLINPPLSKKNLEAEKKENAKQLADDAFKTKERLDFAKAADHELPGSDVFSSAPEPSVSQSENPSKGAEREGSWGPYLVPNNQDDHQVNIEFSL